MAEGRPTKSAAAKRKYEQAKIAVQQQAADSYDVMFDIMVQTALNPENSATLRFTAAKAVMGATEKMFTPEQFEKVQKAKKKVGAAFGLSDLISSDFREDL